MGRDLQGGYRVGDMKQVEMRTQSRTIVNRQRGRSTNQDTERDSAHVCIGGQYVYQFCGHTGRLFRRLPHRRTSSRLLRFDRDLRLPHPMWFPCNISSQPLRILYKLRALISNDSGMGNCGEFHDLDNLLRPRRQQ